MATKAPAAKKSAKKTTRKTTRRAVPAMEMPSFPGFDPTSIPGLDMAKMNVVTPEQAIELYKANARIALDIINAAIENTAKVRRLQFESEEETRARSRKAAKAAVEAKSPTEMMAAGQTASQEALEHAMRYWGQMFELIAEMQKRLWVMMEGQMQGVPGIKETRAAMSMMPDLTQAQNIIKAMQGVVGAGGNAFESMQKVMGDLSRFMPGMRR